MVAETLSSSNENNTIFATENSTNKQLGQQIRHEIESLAQQFIQIDDQEKTLKRSKKSLILEIADKFEHLHQIGEYPFPINNICSSIYRYLQRKGFDTSDRYIQLVLRANAPQYVNSSYQKANSSDIDIKFEQEEIMEAVRTLKHANLDILTREQKQELVPELFETAYTYEDHCRTQNITPAPHSQAQEAHYDSDEADPYRDQITTDMPPRIPTNLAEATRILAEYIINCGHTIMKTAEMMENYPPEKADIEMEKQAVLRIYEWATFWDLLAQGLKNGTDRKYRRSVVQWTQIADDEESWGKHAASSKNPYTAKFKDKDGNWKEETRKLTREQIGDVAPKAREFAKLFKRSVPACLDMVRWAEIYMFPYASGLSVKLHAKLQDRSLR